MSGGCVRLAVVMGCAVAAARLLCGCSGPPTGEPIQLCICKDVQLHDARENVDGVRLTLWSGSNKRVNGLDLGVVMSQCTEMNGLQVTALVNSVCKPVDLPFLVPFSGTMRGVQIGGLVNLVGLDWWGLQAAGLLNIGCGSGIQMAGLANLAYSRFPTTFTLQAALVLNTAREAYGAQIGSLCIAERLRGLQVGAVNVCDKQMDEKRKLPSDEAPPGTVAGVQIGLGNYAKENGGLQVALYNHAKKHRGVQIGLINIAPDQAIPFLPIIHPGLWPKK